MVLEAIVIAVGDHVEEQADLCRVLMEARTQAAYAGGPAELVRASQAEAQADMTRLIAAGIASGEWPADTDAALHARLILASIHGLMAEWHLRPRLVLVARYGQDAGFWLVPAALREGGCR
jgi:transcriptional regulator BetI-like protein